MFSFKTPSEPQLQNIRYFSQLKLLHLNAILTQKRCYSILLLSVILYFICSCTKGRVDPTDFSGTDSLNIQDDSGTLDTHVRTDSAFYNADGKIVNAVCYGPFRDGQGPGSELSNYQIKEDLLIMEKHWDALRLYITDDNAKKILKIIYENNIVIKVMLGTWISGDAPEDNAIQVEKAILLANSYPDIVHAISCGNEIFGLAGSDIFVSNKSEIIGYLNDIKERTNVQVTVNDLYFVWTNDYYSDVVAALDFITMHFYGQWFNISMVQHLTGKHRAFLRQGGAPALGKVSRQGNSNW